MSSIHAIVGGFPELADALERTGQLGGVIRVGSTGQLREAIQGAQFPKEKNRVVFIFSDALTQDTEQSLEYLAGRMSATGWKVIILGFTPRARDIVAAHPSAGMLDGPFSVNQTFAAIMGLGVGPLEPVATGFDAIYPSAPDINRPAVRPAAPAEAGPAPAPRNAWTRVNDADPAPAPAPAPFAPVVERQPAPAPFAPVVEQRPAPAPFAPVVEQRPAPAPFAPVVERQPAPAPAAGFVRPASEVDELRPAPAPAPSGFVRPDTAPPPAAPQQPAAPSQPTQTPAGFARPDTTPAGFARPGAAPPSTSPAQPETRIERPVSPGPIGRRVGAYQDFAPSGSSNRRRGYVITVASPKGGTGKSSLSVNLSVFLGLTLRGTNKRVCLVDANFQQADTGKMLNEYSPNVTHILKDEGSMVPERIEQYLVHRRDLNTSFLLGPPTPRDASPVFFNARLYTQIIEVLRQNFDYILIDTPVAELYHDILRGFALPQADYIVVPITPALHTLMNADGWLRTITQSRHQGGDDIDQERIGIVLNQAQDGVDCDEDQVKRELFAWRFVGSVPLTKEWVKCNNNNEFVATKNFPDINDALANILYNATGEQILLEGMQAGMDQDRPRGIKGLLRRKR
jgi:MinD-like ATPase involved in chromosome partitioning or flagellar assembly